MFYKALFPRSALIVVILTGKRIVLKAETYEISNKDFPNVVQR